MTISTRREFLGVTAATAAAAVFAGAAQPGEKRPDLRLGLIGAGWYGMVDAKAALKAGGVEIAPSATWTASTWRQPPMNWKSCRAGGPRPSNSTRIFSTSKDWTS